MITVRRSDTGTFVLLHEPSGRVVVGEDLQATYERMEALLREHPSPPGVVGASPSRPAAPSRWAWLVGVALLALLPFLWLAVLHYTLGGMLDELRTSAAAQRTAPAEELEQLQTSLHELEQTVERLQSELGRDREGEDPTAQRTGRARRPAEQGSAHVPEPDVDPPESTEDGD
ncbi:MAG: hypothetical protein H6712_00210 [Myxococcales bacterium]|nr:hypothetical protein [Myxococcales bacterium]MCB9712247.1 hypothetical protein [Myxococcales bacterium]